VKKFFVGWARRAHRASQQESWFGSNHLVGTVCPPYRAPTQVTRRQRVARPTELRSALRATILVAGLITSAGSTAATESDPLIAPTNPHLTFAGIVDEWKDEKREGFVRIAILDLGWEHVVSRVWLQWIERSGDDASGNTIVATTEVRELSRWVTVTPPTLPKTARTALLVTGTHSFANCDFVFQVQATSIGKYTGKFVRPSAKSSRACAFKGGKIVFE
jgi:hypothetical protein